MTSGYADGFLIVLFSRFFAILQAVSAVEWMKKFGFYILARSEKNHSPEDFRRVANLWIDVFIVAKWLVVTVFLLLSCKGFLPLFVVSYLLFFNCFSYFIYHGWGSGYSAANLPVEAQLRRDRRRLISFLQAVFFSFLGFSYLYSCQIYGRLEWPTHPNFLDGLYLSLSNSFTLTYSGFQPKDQIARGVLLLQVINMLVFVTILIGNSVPVVGRSSQ